MVSSAACRCGARQDVSEFRTLVVRRAMRCYLVRVARRLT
jgi:hypothetical protein